MASLCVHLLRSRRFWSLPSPLTQNLHRPAGPPQLRTRAESSLSRAVSGSLFRCPKRTTSPVHRRPPLSSWSNAIRTSPPHPAPTLRQPGLHFHSSASLRALPVPLLLTILKPLQKLLAVILGRSIRKWWGSLPANRRQLLRQWVWQHRWHLAAVTGVAIVTFVLLILIHLDESPVTGRTRLLVLSREHYTELAALTAEAYMQEYAELLLPVSDTRHQVVERVVQHLAQRNKDIPDMANISWRTHVVQSPEINAFVLPNGEVFMFTGMLETMKDVHQLTIVLGHEMAHAILGHSAEQASLSHVVDLLTLILLTAIWALCPQDNVAMLGHWVQQKLSQLMFSRPFSRKLESEADQVGMQLAAKACADVRAGPVFWQQMELREQLSGEPALPEWLSTHPSHRNRFTQMDRLIPQNLELREKCVCPPLPAADPRVVFENSVRVLLDEHQKKSGGGLEGAHKLHLPQLTHVSSLPQRPTPLPPGLSASLLSLTAPASAPKLDGDSKAPVPPGASGSTALAPAQAPTPTPAEGTS